jgi:xanthine dehydrogenase molybdenum-binding subunit
MYTNNPPSGAFRGFGVTQSAFAVEQNMDLLAEMIGMDALEFRQMNAQKVGVTTATGQLLRESIGLLQTIDDVKADMAAHHNGSGFQWAWRNGNKAYGWGLACAYKNTGLGGGAPDKSAAEVEAFEDGFLEVRTSAADMGQGLAHVVAQCAAEELS